MTHAVDWYHDEAERWIREVIDLHAELRSAREAERAALANLAGAVQGAKASGVGVTQLASVLGYSRRAVYDLLERTNSRTASTADVDSCSVQ